MINYKKSNFERVCFIRLLWEVKYEIIDGEKKP